MSRDVTLVSFLQYINQLRGDPNDINSRIGGLGMLEKIFWDVFQKTGNIEAYLALKECSHCKTEASKELFPETEKLKREKKIKKDE